MVDLNAFIKETAEHSKKVFEGQKRIMSFQQWLEDFCKRPVNMGRSAAQYLVDVFDHYGSEKVDGIGEKVRRFKLFDAPFDNKKDKLIGHEDVAQDIYDILRRFAATGHSDRLLLLHGPNGSGKSTMIELIIDALEDYSALDEGALFRFNWIFTERLDGKGHLGFGARDNELPEDTLAFVDENLISCKIGNELKENPIFLIPREERINLLNSLIQDSPKDTQLRERLRGDFLVEGELSAKSKAIFDALMNAFRGDWTKVIRHVQVERFFISRRYRRGTAIVEPQQQVDAHARPLSFESNITLPPVLQGLQLEELSGDLVDGNGGLVEYSDWLKRPMELNKYLLNTCERGTVSLRGTVAYLNLSMFGTCNEKYLSAFKGNPDFTSFKGRIELIRIGYLRDWRKEREVYADFLKEIVGERHVAPHTLDVAALWAVMTRLRKPDPSNYPEKMTGIIRALTPLEKARLYSESKAPERLNTEQKQLLLSHIADLRDEHDDDVAEFEQFVCAAYEGRRGASAREMKSLLAEAVEMPGPDHLSPQSVFKAMRDLLRDTSVYDFLRLEIDEKYHDTDGFIEEIADEYFRWVLVEAYDSLQLIEEKEFERRVEDYFKHVRGYVQGEKVINSQGAYEKPNEEIMEGFEKLMDLKETADTLRRNLMTKIAAYSLEHPKQKLTYADIFPDLIYKLRDSYYKQKQADLERLGAIVIQRTENDEMVPRADRDRVKAAMKLMIEKYGYNDDSAREAFSFILARLKS